MVHHKIEFNSTVARIIQVGRLLERRVLFI